MVSPTAATVYFWQIFLKRAAKQSARNTSAGFPWVKWPQILWNLALHQSLPNLLRNLLRNPVELDLALHQSLADLLRKNLTRCLHQSTPELFWAEDPISLRKKKASVVSPTAATFYFYKYFSTICEAKRWKHLSLLQSLTNLLRNLLWNPIEPNLTCLCTNPPGTFSGTPFSGTLLNLTCLCSKPPRPSPEGSPKRLCTKASQTFSRTFYATRWTWIGFAPRLPGTFSGTFSGTCSETPKPCWTWPGSAPKPLRPSPEPSPAPCWTWPGSDLAPEPSPELCWTWAGSAPKLPRPAPKPSPEPSPEPCWSRLGFAPGTFSGTFSTTLLHLTWLCNKALQTFSGTFSGTFYGTFSRTFSGTLLNLTWLCTKPPGTLSGTFFSGTLLNLHQTLPNLLRNLLRNRSAPKPPRPSPQPSTEPVEPDLDLHYGFLEPFPELSSEPCWTWPGSAPKPPRPSPETSPEPCWTWPDSAPKPPDLRRNLLRNLLGNPVEPDLFLTPSPEPSEPSPELVEPDPAPAPVHTGAILGWRPH